MQYKGYKGGVEPMEKIAVLIPCYNEEKTIKKVVRDWKKELPEATIYVYNNNSTDRTVEIAKEAGAIYKIRRLVLVNLDIFDEYLDTFRM